MKEDYEELLAKIKINNYNERYKFIKKFKKEVENETNTI